MEQLSEYSYKSNQETDIYELHSASFQGVKRLFVLAHANAANAANNEAGVKDNTKYILPSGNIESYNLLIDTRKFYDHLIDYLIKQYDEITKALAGQADDYTTGCLLDYACFKNNYRPITTDLNKQKNFRCWSKSNSTKSISRSCCRTW